MSNLTQLDFVRFYMNRNNYNEYLSYLNLSTLGKESYEFIISLREFYDLCPEVSEIDVESFKTWFLQFKIKDVSDASKETYKIIFDRLNTRPATSQDIVLKAIKLQAAGDKLKKMAESKIDADKLRMVLDEVEQVENKVDEIDEMICSKSYNDLFDEDPFENGYSWALACMNENINKIPEKGFFMVVAGRPNACKSSFLLQNIVHVAKQIPDDGKIIWFNNEGSVEEMKRRFAVSVMKREKDKIYNARKTSKFDVDAYLTKTIGNSKKVVFVELAHKGIREAERTLKKYKDSVKLIIVDMLDHINLRSQYKHITNSDALFGLMYQWWLGAACIYASVIGTSQISFNKDMDPQYPSMEDLAGSKTLKSGAVTCQLMIGRDEEENGLRYLSTPKNKYGKGNNTWHREIIFEPETNQFREL